jgi:hypothetical protein
MAEVKQLLNQLKKLWLGFLKLRKGLTMGCSCCGGKNFAFLERCSEWRRDLGNRMCFGKFSSMPCHLWPNCWNFRIAITIAFAEIWYESIWGTFLMALVREVERDVVECIFTFERTHKRRCVYTVYTLYIYISNIHIHIKIDILRSVCVSAYAYFIFM